VIFSGGGESRERVTGEWRALDVEIVEMQRRANGWAVDRRDGDLEVNIISSERYCECLTKVREDCGQISKSKVPTDNIDAMRKELEGVGIGCGECNLIDLIDLLVTMRWNYWASQMVVGW
jgi:hypothetical protein